MIWLLAMAAFAKFCCVRDVWAGVTGVSCKNESAGLIDRGCTRDALDKALPINDRY